MVANSQKSSKKSLTQHAISGFFWLFSGAAFQHVLRLAALIILARLISPADFGVMTAAMIVINFAQIFSWVGIGPSIIQIPELKSTHIRTGLVISVLFGLITGVIVWFLAPAIAFLLKTSEVIRVLRILSIIFPITGFAVISESLLRRAFKFNKIAIADLFSFGLGYGIVSVVLALHGYGYYSLVGGVVAQYTIRACLLSLMQGEWTWRLSFNLSAAKELFNLGGGFTCAQILNYIALQGDYFIVGRYLGMTALGFYNRSYSLMTSALKLFNQILGGVLFPTMARVQEEPEKLRTAFRRSISITSIVLIPISLAIYVMAPEIILVLLGPQWEQAVVPFKILTLGMYFRTSYKISGTLTQALGAVYRNAARQAIYAGAVLGGAFIGQYWGLRGVACGVLLALFIQFCVMSQLALKLMSFSFYDFVRAHFYALRLGILFYIQSWILVNILRLYKVPAIIIIASLILTLCASLALLLFVKNEYILSEDGKWFISKFNPFQKLKLKAEWK
jgi:O-antigen/teichoic acid export membrane protein